MDSIGFDGLAKPERESLRSGRVWAFVRDGLVFLRANLKHYALALPGLQLAFMPNAPEITGFFYPVIYQSVLEYRGYLLVAPFACAAALYVPRPWLIAFVVWLFLRSLVRVVLMFPTRYLFWRQIWRESRGHPRIRLHFVLELITEIERRKKKGLVCGHLQDECFALMTEIEKEGKRNAKG